LMQFIAECGIEYGLQFVTQFFFNPPDCLFLKKSIKFLQSYEKTRAKQKKTTIFFCFAGITPFFLFDETTGALLVDDVEPLQLLDVLVE